MKPLFSAALLFLTLNCFGQYFPSDLTDETIPVTWLGLDFTEARFVVKPNLELDNERLPFLPKIWNDQVVSDETTYPLKKAFHRSSVTRDIDMMKMLNSRFNGEEMVTEELYLLYSYNIESAFSRYTFEGLQKGIGMVFIVEAIDFANKQFSGYMMSIDLGESRIIKTYYMKTRFPYELEEEELIKPFRQILLQFEEKLDEKK